MIVEMVRMSEQMRSTELKYLHSEYSGLVQEYEEARENLEWSIWKALELKRNLRERQNEVMDSIEYINEERVSYRKEMVRDALKPIRDEMEEISGHREVFRDKLNGIKFSIQENRNMVELLHL